MIGIDPHKGSHTAYALDEQEQRVGQVRVRASSKQVEVLPRWAAGCPQRPAFGFDFVQLACNKERDLGAFHG